MSLVALNLNNEALTCTFMDDLTPRASRTNLRSTSQFSADPRHDDDFDNNGQIDISWLERLNNESENLGSDDSESDEDVSKEDGFVNRCEGQLVEWTPGSVWETYAYQQHDSEDIGWIPIGFKGSHWIRVRSKSCHGVLSEDKEKKRQNCKACNSLLNSEELCRFMSRASKDTATPHTPYIYLNFRQMKSALIASRKMTNTLRLQVCILF